MTAYIAAFGTLGDGMQVAADHESAIQTYACIGVDEPKARELLALGISPQEWMKLAWRDTIDDWGIECAVPEPPKPTYHKRWHSPKWQPRRRF